MSTGWVREVPLLGHDDASNEGDPTLSPITDEIDSIVQEIEQSRPETGPSRLAGDAPFDGILNPVVVEQNGYSSSSNLSARTDSYENLVYDLPLDTAHDWIADKAEVTLWNLEKLYAVNGSFSDGYPGTNVAPNTTVSYHPLGWDADSTDTATYSDDVQLAAYDSTGSRYVTAESQGGKVGQNAFGHAAGTRIVWIQSVQNAPYAEDFVLSLSCFYLRGPIDGPGLDTITGNCSVALFVDGINVWNMSLLLLTQRGVWFSSGEIPVHVAGAPSSFLLEIGLIIDQTLVLDKRYDYDGDASHLADGIGNAAYITVYLDDVSFLRAVAPTPEQVQLEFVQGSRSEPLTGSSGTYAASILNTSYWTATPVSVYLSSNTSVSFDYKTRLHSHRFTDSNWRTDISSLGVAYTIDHGFSASLSLCAYVGYLGNYEDPEMIIRFPVDWENLTVSDPFLIDLTGTCIIGNGSVTVPTSIINRLGWWEIRLESPNYAKSIKTQISDVTWRNETTFRIGNTTRADITIGTLTQVLGSLTAVNVIWLNPSDIIWHNKSISGGSSGQIYSDSWTFTNDSSPAGEWWVEAYWSNGTEVAYGRAGFAVHHSASLIGDPSDITTDAGSVIRGIVRYTDRETNEPLMDSSASVRGNWSAILISFDANPLRLWWEADFDTSIVGAGEFAIVVSASRLFYDDASCVISLHSINVTRLTSPNAPWTAAEWGSFVSLTFRYEAHHSPTDTWSHVSNESDVSASVNWTSGYWSVSEDSDLGVYSITLNSSVVDTGTHLLNATFSKPHHQSKTLLLTLIVSPVTSSLSLIGEGFARVNLDQEHDLTLRYLDSGGSPISGANVIVDSVSPPLGLAHTTVVEVNGEPGNYSLSLTPHAAGVFTVRFVATGNNTEPASTIFVLVVNDVDTILEIFGPASMEIGITDVYSTTFRYETLNGTGVDNAQINVTYSGGTVDGLSWELSEIGFGDYSVEFGSSSSGTYVVTIAASKPHYQGDSDAFFLIVKGVNTTLTSLNGTADIIGFGKYYTLCVSYTNSTGYGLSGANVTVESVVPATGLLWGDTTTESQGVYSILLTPQETNTFTLLVQANLLNHQTRFVFFTLTATEIATSLNMLTPGTTISLDQNFTAYLLFHDEDFTGLEGASLTIPNPPAGASFSEFDDLGNGSYRVTVTPLEVGIFDIVFKASKNGYQNGYASLTLGAVRIPTSAHVAGVSSPGSAVFSEPYELPVLYERIDTGLNVTGATIDLQASPNNGISWSYIEADDGYLITIETTRIGRWTLTITANKTGYASSSIEFIFDVDPIPIQVVLLSGNSAVEGRPFGILVRVTRQGTSIPITNASVSFRISVDGSGEFEVMHETSTAGEYTAQFTLRSYSDTTDYTLEVKIEKDNYLYLQGIFEQPFIKTLDIPGRMQPLIIGGSGILAATIILLGGLRISSKRKKVQLDHDLANKRRFDDADNIIGVIVLHKRSGLPIYSKMMKGGFEEGIVAAFITAVTHFREEFEMFDEEAMEVIPISDIIRAVQTRNLICAFITVKSASIEHNRKMEAYARQVGTYLDDLVSEMPSEVADSRIIDMLDYIFHTTMDGFLLKFYKVATSEKFPSRYQLLDEIVHDTEMRHCIKPVLLAKGLTSRGLTEAKGCTLVLEAIEKELIVVCEEHESEVPEIDFAEFFSKHDETPSSES